MSKVDHFLKSGQPTQKNPKKISFYLLNDLVLNVHNFSGMAVANS